MKNIVDVYLDKRAMGRSKKRVYSLRDTTTRLVSQKSSIILLKNVSLVVRQGGRIDTLNRMNAEGCTIKKTVHAFLKGSVVNRGRNAVKKAKEIGLYFGSSSAIPVGYDPVKTDSWVELDQYRMPDNINLSLNVRTTAEYALLHEDGILVNI